MVLNAASHAQVVADAERFLAQPAPRLRVLHSLAERLQAFTLLRLQHARELLVALNARDAPSYRQLSQRFTDTNEELSGVGRDVRRTCHAVYRNTAPGLPPEFIQAAVRENFPRFAGCYERGLARNPELVGRVTVRAVVGEAGWVRSASAEYERPPVAPECVPDPETVGFFAKLGYQPDTPAEPTSLPDTEVVECIVEAFRSVAFPRPFGGSVTIVYPFMLSEWID